MYIGRVVTISILVRVYILKAQAYNKAYSRILYEFYELTYHLGETR